MLKKNISFVYFLLIGILFGIQIEKFFSSDSIRENVKKFNDVLTYAAKYYHEEVNVNKMTEKAIQEMLEELDPFSTYIPPKKMEQIQEEFKGEFSGIGVEFQILRDTIFIVSATSGGPSEKVGIMAGDRIVKIEGESAVGLKTEDVRSKLRGKAGTIVNITVHRPGEKNLLDFTIVRDKIPLYSVEASFIVDKNVGYISVSRFGEKTFSEFYETLERLKNEGMKKLILDLRNNPGGYLNQAVEIADLFIDGNKMIVYTKGRRPDVSEEYKASLEYIYEKIPLIVLVNSGSASASEILSGAIQDWDRGLIVGQETYGKGLVQRQFILSDNSAVRITVSKYYTPSGRLIQKDFKDLKKAETNQTKEDVDIIDNSSHELEKKSNKPKYSTFGGRTVIGGGGITPDYIIISNKLTSYTVGLLRKNIFSDFHVSRIQKDIKKIKDKYNSLEQFANSFSLSDEEFNIFVKFAESKGIVGNENEIIEDKDYIKARIKAQIARDIWGNNGWYRCLLEVDNQFLKAKELFPEAEKLAKLK